MKAILVVICILLTGILWLQVDARQARVRSEQKEEANHAPASGPVVEIKTLPPIIAKCDVMHYGPEEAGRIGFQGKIYNPNAFGLTNVRVQYHVYTPANDAAAKQFKSVHMTDEACESDFAYLPPRTTYDFETNRITARTPEVLNSIGLNLDSLRINLQPEVTFEKQEP